MPTFYHGKSAAVYIDDSSDTERDFTSYVTSVGIPAEVETAEVSTLGDDDKVYVTGLRDRTISIEGKWDATVDGYLSGLLGGTPRAWRVFPAGSAAGLPYVEGSAILTSYEVSADVGDAISFSAEFQNSGAVTRTTV
jgi:predicted secreted protein